MYTIMESNVMIMSWITQRCIIDKNDVQIYYFIRKQTKLYKIAGIRLVNFAFVLECYLDQIQEGGNCDASVLSTQGQSHPMHKC